MERKRCKVKVDIYSPDIPEGSSDFTSGVLEVQKIHKFGDRAKERK